MKVELFKKFPFYFSNDRSAVLFIPEIISPQEFQWLKQQIEFALGIIDKTSVAHPTVEAASASEQPGDER